MRLLPEPETKLLPYMAVQNTLILKQNLRAALITCLGAVPDLVFVKWGELLLKGGFKKADPIKTRITQLVESESPVPRWILEMARPYLPHNEALHWLDSHAIAANFPALEVIVGRDYLLLNMLADDRVELQKLAVQFAEVPAEPRWEFNEANMQMTADLIGPLQELVKASIVQIKKQKADTANILAEISLQDAVQAKAEHDRLVQELEQTKEQHRKNTQQLVEANNRKLGELTAANQEHATQLKEATAQAKTLEDNLDAQQKAFAIAVETEVDKRLADINNKWLIALEATSNIVTETQSDVVTRANDVLTRQAKQDKHSGNRVQLSKRLASLKTTRQQLTEAVENSISLLPDVRKVLGEIEDEVAKIESTLKCNSLKNPTAEKLKLKIVESASYEQIDECSEILGDLESAQLLSPEDCQLLIDALYQKCCVLSAKSNEASQQFKDTGWTLRGLVHKNQPTLLMIDGHNVLFALKDVFGGGTEAGSATEAARENLLAAVNAFVGERNNVEAIVYFDGPVAKKTQLTENIQVQFSGGTGENRADAAIIDGLLAAPPCPEQKQFVVTNDRALRTESLSLGAKFVPVDVFAVLLKDFNCIKPK